MWEEYEEDLWHQTEFNVTKRKPTPRPSKHTINARPSLFDDEDSGPLKLPVQQQQTKMVRGRQIKVHKKEQRPGTEEYIARENVRQIREVSGLGYSNALIERSIYNGKTANLTRDENRRVPDVSFVPSSSRSGSSKSGSSYDEIYEDAVAKHLPLDIKNFPPLK